MIGLCFLILFLIMLEPLHNQSSCYRYEDTWTKEHFLSLRGLLAVIIIIGHTYNGERYWGWFDNIALMIKNAGYLCVAIFFFLSGYGIVESYKNNKEYFGKKFVIKKISDLLVPYWVANLYYIILYYIIEFPDVVWYKELTKIILSFFCPLFNKAAWYIFSLFILYAIAYIFIPKLDNYKKIYKHIGIFVILCLYVIIVFAFRLGSWWYVSIFAFVTGTIISDYKIQVIKLLENKLLFAFLIFIFIGIQYIITNIVNRSSLIVILEMINAVVVVFVVCGIFQRLIIKDRIITKLFNWCGQYSYYIYLMQGIAVKYCLINLPKYPAIGREINCIVNVVLAIGFGILLNKQILFIKNKQRRKLLR